MEIQSIKDELKKTLISSGVDDAKSDLISLDQLAELTGISKKYILKELFLSGIGEDSSELNPKDQIAMSDLRDAMLKYLDSAMMDES